MYPGNLSDSQWPGYTTAAIKIFLDPGRLSSYFAASAKKTEALPNTRDYTVPFIISWYTYTKLNIKLPHTWSAIFLLFLFQINLVQDND